MEHKETKTWTGLKVKPHFTEFYKWFSKFGIILIISAILGLICGFVMVGFTYLLNLFALGFSYIPYFISPLIAGGLTSLLVRVGYRKNLFLVMGTGASEFVSEVTEGELGYNRVPILFGKTFATSWTYGSGILCGLEGPGLLVGANIGYVLAQKFEKYKELDKQDYYFIGASACTSAILKTPISGALFCAELPFTNHLKYRSLLPSIFSSIISFLIYTAFFEFQPFIITDLSALEQINYFDLLPLLIIFAIGIGFFVLIFITLLRGWMKKLHEYFKHKTGFWMLPLFGGGLYSLFLFIIIPIIDPNYYIIYISPETSVLSYIIDSVRNIDSISFLLLTSLFLFAILFSIGFYNSAGLILPLMLLGALLGGFFGVTFFPEYPELFVILGISAVLSAAINNPITAIIIIVEMTWDPFLFIPAGITTILAYICSGPNTIIPGQRNVKCIQLE